MTKKEMVTKLKSAGYQNPAPVLDMIYDIICQELIEGRPFKISGAFTIYPKRMAATRKRNPRTGEPLNIPEKTRLKIRTAGGMIRELNK